MVNWLLREKETLQKFYTASSKVRAFGELYPRVDMAEGLAENEYVAPYLADAPYAKSWYLSSNTFDNGINDQLIKYYQDAVTSMVVEGKKATNALETVNQGTTQVLRQYGVSGALSR